MKKVFIYLIKLYQRTISPDHGVFSNGKRKVCRYSPTCSEYMIQAITKYGIIKGGFKGIWRILRCNPFSRGGFDPVEPVPFKKQRGETSSLSAPLNVNSIEKLNKGKS